MEFDESQPYQAALDDEGTIYYFHTETHVCVVIQPAVLGLDMPSAAAAG